jgi:hypothetical protein
MKHSAPSRGPGVPPAVEQCRCLEPCRYGEPVLQSAHFLPRLMRSVQLLELFFKNKSSLIFWQ